MTQDHSFRAKRSGTNVVGGAKQSHNGNFQSSGEMQRAGISPDEQARAPGQGNELSDGAGKLKAIPMARSDDSLCPWLFSGSGVYQSFQIVPRQALRDLSKALRWPLF